MIIEADEEKLHVRFGPCSLFQNCLCCGGCCKKPLARGELQYEHITKVEVVQGDCHDCGINGPKHNIKRCAYSVFCCPENVVQVHQEGGPVSCCGRGQILRYAVENETQAVELQTFLASKMSDATGTSRNNNGMVDGSINSVNPLGYTNPPSYASVTIAPPVLNQP